MRPVPKYPKQGDKFDVIFVDLHVSEDKDVKIIVTPVAAVATNSMWAHVENNKSTRFYIPRVDNIESNSAHGYTKGGSVYRGIVSSFSNVKAQAVRLQQFGIDRSITILEREEARWLREQQKHTRYRDLLEQFRIDDGITSITDGNTTGNNLSGGITDDESRGTVDCEAGESRVREA